MLAEVEVRVGLPAGGGEGALHHALGEARAREEPLGHPRGEIMEGERRAEPHHGGDGHRVVAPVHMEAGNVVAREALRGGHAREW